MEAIGGIFDLPLNLISHQTQGIREEVHSLQGITDLSLRRLVQLEVEEYLGVDSMPESLLLPVLRQYGLNRL